MEGPPFPLPPRGVDTKHHATLRRSGFPFGLVTWPSFPLSPTTYRLYRLYRLTISLFAVTKLGSRCFDYYNILYFFLVKEGIETTPKRLRLCVLLFFGLGYLFFLCFLVIWLYRLYNCCAEEDHEHYINIGCCFSHDKTFIFKKSPRVNRGNSYSGCILKGPNRMGQKPERKGFWNSLNNSTFYLTQGLFLDPAAATLKKHHAATTRFPNTRFSLLWRREYIPHMYVVTRFHKYLIIHIYYISRLRGRSLEKSWTHLNQKKL